VLDEALELLLPERRFRDLLRQVPGIQTTPSSSPTMMSPG
jgi:hypothetical protein